MAQRRASPRSTSKLAVQLSMNELTYISLPHRDHPPKSKKEALATLAERRAFMAKARNPSPTPQKARRTTAVMSAGPGCAFSLLIIMYMY